MFVTGFSELKGAPLYSENRVLVTKGKEPNIKGPLCVRQFGVMQLKFVLCKYVQNFLRNTRGPAPLYS
jgi:hypothetical protein